MHKMVQTLICVIMSPIQKYVLKLQSTA